MTISPFKMKAIRNALQKHNWKEPEKLPPDILQWVTNAADEAGMELGLFVKACLYNTYEWDVA